MFEGQIKSIALIGAGNVGSQLGIYLNELGLTISYVMSRNRQSALKLASKVGAQVIQEWNEDYQVDLVLICVSDDAITHVVNQFPKHQRMAYTSGSVLLSSFPAELMLGVFYPLQTFSIGRTVDFKTVPLLVEASTIEFGNELLNLAKKCSDQVQFTSSFERKKIHISAVLVNNFTNHLIYIAQQFLNKHDLNFDLLKPLMLETISKLDQFEPFEAQTGPARRNDLKIIQEHLKMLSEDEKVIYQVLTDSILKTYNKKDDKL